MTRPGGRIVMGNWIPNDPTLVAQILRISAAYSPRPPEGFVSPMTWGVETNVVEWFAAAGVSQQQISFARETYHFNTPGTPNALVATFRRYYGQTMNACNAAEANGREADLQAELEALFNEKNVSPSKVSTSIPATFMGVTVAVCNGGSSRVPRLDCGRPAGMQATIQDPMTSPTFAGPLHETVATTPTQYLNDSCSIEELNYAIPRGAVGATSNPVIVGNVLQKEMHLWSGRIREVIAANPTWSEIRVARTIYEELAVAGSKLLLPEFEASAHRRGRLSIQTDPAANNDPATIRAQAVYFAGLAPNMQVKVPATNAGISVLEELTFDGVNVNVTVSFNVPQVMAIGEAIERGLQRREAAGLDVAEMAPYATMMVGRLDDWMKVLVTRHDIDIERDYLEWAGVACFKKAYGLYQEHRYRTRLLSAAYRNFLHWTEFVGGEISMTIPYDWQVKFNESDVRPDPASMSTPVAPEIVDALYTKIPDFRRSYDADGMTVEEFDTFGPTLRTLRGFIEAWHSFVGTMRDFLLPNPD